MDSDSQKECQRCGELKSVSEYHRNSNKRDGLHTICKSCNKENAKKWYAEHSDKAKESRRLYHSVNRSSRLKSLREYRQSNKAKLSASQKTWREANSERKRSNDIAWQKKNPSKVRSYRKVSEHRRRAQKLKSKGQYTARDIDELKDKQKSRCPCCKASIAMSFEIDHIMPLSKGGSNDLGNIQLLCPPCNRRKSAKHPIQFMQEMGYLL